MGRIFISAGHFTGESGAISVIGTKEADEMIKTRDALIQELESRGLKKDQDFFSVPDTINLKRTIAWILD
jgi:N-acetylmuramoyl-L-alanine amidase